MADRLTLTSALADAGIERTAAERVASVIFDAINENVATKADLQLTEANLHTELAAMRSDLALVEHRLLARLGGLIVAVAGLMLAAIRYLPHT
jgi:hypothetical protein